jgi:hypothetical protein
MWHVNRFSHLMFALAIVAVGTIVAVPPPAPADVVYMKDGFVLQG